MIRQQVRLGDLLIEEGLITQSQLDIALATQKSSGFLKKLGETLVHEGFVSNKEMAIVLSKQLKIDFVDLYGEKIDFHAFGKF